MLYLEKETYAVLGACFSVYKDKGCGFTEPIYQECLEIEFDHLKLPVRVQPALALSYRGRTLRHHFVPDFLCFDTVILEIKALKAITDEHRAQLLNYLSATGMEVGLLVNFGHYPKIEHERMINRLR
jgi:GxxExxY protein